MNIKEPDYDCVARRYCRYYSQKNERQRRATKMSRWLWMPTWEEIVEFIYFLLFVFGALVYVFFYFVPLILFYALLVLGVRALGKMG